MRNIIGLPLFVDRPGTWKTRFSFADPDRPVGKCIALFPAQPSPRAGPGKGFGPDPGYRSLSYMHIFQQFFVNGYVIHENPSSSKHFSEFKNSVYFVDTLGSS